MGSVKELEDKIKKKILLEKEIQTYSHEFKSSGKNYSFELIINETFPITHNLIIRNTRRDLQQEVSLLDEDIKELRNFLFKCFEEEQPKEKNKRT